MTDYWVWEKSELAKEVPQEPADPNKKTIQDLSSGAFKASDLDTTHEMQIEYLDESELESLELSPLGIMTIDNPEFEEITERVVEIIMPPNFDGDPTNYETRAHQITARAFEKILTAKVNESEAETDMTEITNRTDQFVEPTRENGISKAGDGAFLVPEEGRDSVLQEIAKEAKQMALSESQQPEDIPLEASTKVENPVTVEVNKEASVEIVHKSPAETIADSEFDSNFQGRAGDKLRQSTKDTLRGCTKRLGLSGEGYWSIEQGDQFMPGDREKISEALFAGFEKLNNKIYDGVNPKQRGELAAKIEPIGASKDFGSSLTRLIKQELTNAEVDLGLRQEFIPGETNPQPIEHPSYKDDNIGISVFKLAAARIFKRVESSVEALGIKVEETKAKFPVKPTKSSEPVSTNAAPEGNVTAVEKPKVAPPVKNKEGSDSNTSLSEGIKDILKREAAAQALKAELELTEDTPSKAVESEKIVEEPKIVITPIEEKITAEPTVVVTPVVETKSEETKTTEKPVDSTVAIDPSDPVATNFGPNIRALLNQMLHDLREGN